jgi:DNA invertase Pin-like site-specific DNA recombinase/uncharacterized protein (UPF0305 family)
MAAKYLAMGSCRVSSPEQLQNGSLNRQRQAVINVAKVLDVTIPDDMWWSGNVSSKRGGNVGRADLEAMEERCKKDRRIKYLIVDEPDRFMRSIDEAAYFEVRFKMLGVKVWYASDPELNKGDLASKLLKFTKYLSAEGSNEERQNKSIKGQSDRLNQGRYPFIPKFGYKKGQERAIPEIHERFGKVLKQAMLNILEKRLTPTAALKELNASELFIPHSPYKMDKFRNILTDPFYAGFVEINKQVKVRNEYGLHEALITKQQHFELVKIMENKSKCQSGPRKNGNPKYPLSNHVHCKVCDNSKNGRVVGFDHGNGKPNSKTYEKYRCRSCKRYILRSELHGKVQQLFQTYSLSPEGEGALLEALGKVWVLRQQETLHEATTLQRKVRHLHESITQQVEAITNPDNASIKQEILASIQDKKSSIDQFENRLDKLQADSDNDKAEFLRFAYDFIANMGSKFFEISKDNSLRCKQIVFPGGFYLDSNKNVYTPQISPLIRLAAKKKDTEVSENSHLVRVRGL